MSDGAVAIDGLRIENDETEAGRDKLDCSCFPTREELLINNGVPNWG
jgi:hypothetical protein